MQHIPQKGRVWQLVRQGCVTGSSCSILLGFSEPVKPSLVPRERQHHKHVNRLVHQMPSGQDTDITAAKLPSTLAGVKSINPMRMRLSCNTSLKRMLQSSLS